MATLGPHRVKTDEQTLDLLFQSLLQRVTNTSILLAQKMDACSMMVNGTVEDRPSV
ncbi:hypothetical protein P4O66_011511 [Electrophorus voltai]|uniref:Uncharacterized protein n=1 Tax=Electrophorus voltai TaxID=2609070 RepID=A0AAD8Z815_9TELE|nr:hypothetical protein P4O66_011511 [Electrophorus voltai]